MKNLTTELSLIIIYNHRLWASLMRNFMMRNFNENRYKLIRIHLYCWYELENNKSITNFITETFGSIH